MKKKIIKKRAKKEIVVTRKWLTDFANTIYNTKTRQFLNLCRNELQNGPDPKDPKRSMHCGLGELYYQLTGKQPKDTHIDEEGVAELVIERSSLAVALKKEKLDFQKQIRALHKNTKYFKYNLEDLVSCVEDDFTLTDHPKIAHMKDILDSIPIENDSDYGERAEFTVKAYRERSMRVARLLREAAKLLPAD